MEEGIHEPFHGGGHECFLGAVEFFFRGGGGWHLQRQRGFFFFLGGGDIKKVQGISRL